MSERSPSDDRAPRPRGAELVIPVLALVFTVYYMVSVHDAPWTAKVSTYFIGTITIVLSVAFVAGVLVAAARGRAALGFSRLTEPGYLLPRRLALLALTVAYVFALEWGGFTLTTFVFLLFSMLILGGPWVWRRALALSAVYALGGYLLFVAAFDTRFPEGPFERLMHGLF